MDVSDIASVGAVDERRATNVIPHLSGCHGKNKKLQRDILQITVRQEMVLNWKSLPAT
jgi:hypothetical protein